MATLSQVPFSSYKDSFIKHKAIFIVTAIFLFCLEILSASSNTLTGASTVSDAVTPALFGVVVGYVQWLFMGVSISVIAKREVAEAIPGIKFSAFGGFVQLVKSMSSWLVFILTILLFGLVLYNFFFGEVNTSPSAEEQTAIYMALFLVGVVMILSLSYASNVFQQYIVNAILVKTKLKKESDSYKNGYWVPFWVLSKMHTVWKSLLLVLIIVGVHFLKGVALSQGYYYLNITMSSFVGVLFILLFVAGIPVYVKERIGVDE